MSEESWVCGILHVLLLQAWIFLQILWLPPTVQKHTFSFLWWTHLRRGIWNNLDYLVVRRCLESSFGEKPDKCQRFATKVEAERQINQPSVFAMAPWWQLPQQASYSNASLSCAAKEHLSVKLPSSSMWEKPLGYVGMQVNRWEVFSSLCECHVHDWECQRSYLALTSSEKNSSPLQRDVRARSRNYPRVGDAWQMSRREENQQAAGTWQSIICQGRFVFCR